MRLHLLDGETRTLFTTGRCAGMTSRSIEAFFALTEAVEAAGRANELLALASLRGRRLHGRSYAFDLGDGGSARLRQTQGLDMAELRLKRASVPEDHE